MAESTQELSLIGKPGETIEIKSNVNIGGKDDPLPYAYHNPETEGNVFWRCGYDADIWSLLKRQEKSVKR